MAVAQVRRRDYSRYSLTIALLLPYCFGGEAMSKNGVVGWFNSLPRLAQLILLLNIRRVPAGELPSAIILLMFYHSTFSSARPSATNESAV